MHLTFRIKEKMPEIYLYMWNSCDNAKHCILHIRTDWGWSWLSKIFKVFCSWTKNPNIPLECKNTNCKHSVSHDFVFRRRCSQNICWTKKQKLSSKSQVNADPYARSFCIRNGLYFRHFSRITSAQNLWCLWRWRKFSKSDSVAVLEALWNL